MSSRAKTETELSALCKIAAEKPGGALYAYVISSSREPGYFLCDIRRHDTCTAKTAGTKLHRLRVIRV